MNIQDKLDEMELIAELKLRKVMDKLLGKQKEA